MNNTKLETKDYNLFYENFQALRNISIQIPEKKVTALIGPSGCGKSTFLRTFNRMNDLIPGVRTTGSVYISNTDLFKIDPVALRQDVGMVFQKPNPFPKSIFENIAYGPRVTGLHDHKKLEEIVETSLRSAALWDEVKDNLGKSGLALWRSAATPLYCPCTGCTTQRDPDG